MMDDVTAVHAWQELDEDEYRWRLETPPAELVGSEASVEGSGPRWAVAIEQGLRLLS